MISYHIIIRSVRLRIGKEEGIITYRRFDFYSLNLHHFFLQLIFNGQSNFPDNPQKLQPFLIISTVILATKYKHRPTIMI